MINDNFLSSEHTLTSLQLLNMMPGNLYWKDISGRYLGGNREIIRVLKLNSAAELVGKDDIEIMGSAYAEKIIENDKKVILQACEEVYVEEGFDINNNRATYLSKKSPFYDDNKKLLGIVGLSIDISGYKERNANSWVEAITNKTTHPQEALPSLSLKQKECLYYLVRGLTAKAIAVQMKISSRTVEKHLEILKIKFRCHSKSTLIHKVFSLGMFN